MEGYRGDGKAGYQSERENCYYWEIEKRIAGDPGYEIIFKRGSTTQRRVFFNTIAVLFFSAAVCPGCISWKSSGDFIKDNDKTLRIAEIFNDTDLPNLDEQLSLKLSKEFAADGRLKVVTQNEDILLKIAIKKVVLQNLKFDHNRNVIEKRIQLLLSIDCMDPGGKKLWREENFDRGLTYTVNPDAADEQKEKLSDLLELAARHIVSKTTTGF